MNIRLQNQISQNHKIILTPKIIEELKVLQMSDISLMEYINVQLNENPLLELENSDIIDSELSNTETTSDENLNYYNYNFKYKEQGSPRDFTEYSSKPISLKQYLLSQVGELRISNETRKICFYLVETINEDGYLGTSISDVSSILQVSTEKVIKALQIVQKLEPAGVGARNLKECIVIQLNIRKQLNDTIKVVVKNYLELLAKKKYKYISAQLGLSMEQVLDIHQKIKCTNPQPGLRFYDSSNIGYINPELSVELIDEKYIVFFSKESTFNLKVNDYYKKLIKSEESTVEAKEFIKSKVLKAIEIMNAIEQRKKTVINVASSIIEYQEDFFKKGYMYQKPLTMKMIAEKVGLHESTISRTVNDKYIQTPRGVFELKYFFSSKLDTGNSSVVSTNAVKNVVKETIQNEDKSNPFSDEEIKCILEKKGLKIARRTIAKYRQELHILTASLRLIRDIY